MEAPQERPMPSNRATDMRPPPPPDAGRVVEKYFDENFLKSFSELDESTKQAILVQIKDHMDKNINILDKARKNAVNLDILGNVSGFLLVLAIGFLSYMFMIKGYPNQAATIMATTAVSIAGIFVIKQLPRNKKTD